MDQADWLAWWPVILGALGLIGGAIAWTSGLFTKRGDTAHERQKAREDTISANSGQTFKNASDLIDQYQQELVEKRKEIAEIKRQYQEDMADLRARFASIERQYLERIGTLERQVATLQDECNSLRLRI